MAFFDNLGKRASEATAKAIQKAQELSETTKLNSLISDEEKKVNNAYYQIGKLYVSLYSGDGDEAFAGMIAGIFEAEQRISAYRAQLQDKKGVQRCEKCGAEVARGVAFCSACGAPMPRAETVVPEDCVRCENCGNMVKREMRFCTSCGKPMVMPTTSETAKSTEIGENADEKLCPSCGAKIETDIAFCTECGAKLETE